MNSEEQLRLVGLRVIVHGEYDGWNAHKRYGIPMCDACREAQRRYQAKRRAEDPQARAKDRLLVRAGDMARRELAHRHPDEYRRLYEHYKARLKKTA